MIAFDRSSWSTLPHRHFAVTWSPAQEPPRGNSIGLVLVGGMFGRHPLHPVLIPSSTCSSPEITEGTGA